MFTAVHDKLSTQEQNGFEESKYDILSVYKLLKIFDFGFDSVKLKQYIEQRLDNNYMYIVHSFKCQRTVG